MNKISVLALIVAIIALVAVFIVPSKNGDGINLQKESVYERVMQIGTIRCGFVPWPLFSVKDPNTGAMSGAEVEYMDALGKLLDLKVTWSEVGYGTFIEELKSDRIDMMCGIWPNAARGKQVDFSKPIEYTAITAFARADDTRFDADLSILNDPAYKLAIIDGDMAQSIAQSDFPRAKILSLPQLSETVLMISNVANGKADAAFLDVSLGFEYMSQNPGKLKVLHPESPVRIGASALAVKKGQMDFLNMINTATDELMDSGVIERILRKYEKYPESFYRVNKPYRKPTSF